MLVLLNSRVALGLEETESTYISLVIFATEPANDSGVTIEAQNGDLPVHSRTLRGDI